MGHTIILYVYVWVALPFIRMSYRNPLFGCIFNVLLQKYFGIKTLSSIFSMIDLRNRSALFYWFYQFKKVIVYLHFECLEIACFGLR